MKGREEGVVRGGWVCVMRDVVMERWGEVMGIREDLEDD